MRKEAFRIHRGCLLVTLPLTIHISCELFHGLVARSHSEGYDPNAFPNRGQNMLTVRGSDRTALINCTGIPLLSRRPPTQLRLLSCRGMGLSVARQW